MIRVLYLHHQTQIGGAERSLLLLLRNLDRLRIDPLVGIPSPGSFSEEVRKPGVSVLPFSFRGIKQVRALLVNFARLVRTIRLNKIELVHSMKH